jgi:hypothetical protein
LTIVRPRGEFAFRVDPQVHKAEPLKAVDLASFGLWERRGLQAPERKWTSFGDVALAAGAEGGGIAIGDWLR